MEQATVELEESTSRSVVNRGPAMMGHQETLGRQKQYADAARSKEQADLLELKEHEAWKTKRDKKIRSRMVSDGMVLDHHRHCRKIRTWSTPCWW